MSFNRVTLFLTTTHANFFFLTELKNTSSCSAVGEIGKQSMFKWNTSTVFSSFGFSQPSCSGFLPPLAQLLVPGGVWVYSYLHQRFNSALPAKFHGLLLHYIQIFMLKNRNVYCGDSNNMKKPQISISIFYLKRINRKSDWKTEDGTSSWYWEIHITWLLPTVVACTGISHV